MSGQRLAIVGPATWDPLVPELQNALAAYDLPCEVDAYGFDTEALFWSAEVDRFERDPARGVFVMPESRAIFGEVIADPRAAFDPRRRGRRAAEFLIGTIDAAGARHPDVSWIIATVESLVPGPGDAVADPGLDPLSVAVDEFNRVLLKAARGRAGWSVFDRRRLTARWGAAVLHDPRLELLARYPASPGGMKRLAERLAAHWAAVCGKMKKVLVLDCDNTLWGGIVGEEGVDGIRIGEDGVGRAYAEFQKAILALESRGVLLALASRNNRPDVEAVFARRREMVIPRDRIAAVEIGWQPKSVGLERLSETLGLSLGDFVLVDDNPAEREEVRRALPEVTVPAFPADPAELPALAYDLGWRYFYRVKIREEDRAKTSQYRIRAAFRHESRATASGEAFLGSLEMKASIAVDSPALVARAAQLTQKTNQFNLTLRRLTEAEIRSRIEDPRYTVFVASLEDRFGSHGWVGLAIFERDEAAACWVIETFLLSCRVLGRSLEHALAKACIDRVRSVAPLPVRARFVPGPKNAQAARFWDGLGFRPVRRTAGGGREYCLEQDRIDGPRAGLVSIRWEEQPIHA